jgi:hypothetical protein
MGYIVKLLSPNEKILFKAKVHWAVFLASIFVFVIAIAMSIYSFPKAVTISIQGQPPPTIPSIDNLFGSTLFCSSIFIYGYSIILTIEALIIYFTTEFAVTNKRVIAKSGFIRIHTLEILLSKVESIDIRQPVLGRILNYGTVTVTGTGGTKQGFKAIAEPMVVRSKVNIIIEKYMQAYNEFIRDNPNMNIVK